MLDICRAVSWKMQKIEARLNDPTYIFIDLDLKEALETASIAQLAGCPATGDQISPELSAAGYVASDFNRLPLKIMQKIGDDLSVSVDMNSMTRLDSVLTNDLSKKIERYGEAGRKIAYRTIKDAVDMFVSPYDEAAFRKIIYYLYRTNRLAAVPLPSPRDRDRSLDSSTSGLSGDLDALKEYIKGKIYAEWQSVWSNYFSAPLDREHAEKLIRHAVVGEDLNLKTGSRVIDIALFKNQVETDMKNRLSGKLSTLITELENGTSGS